jgi:Cu-Zn family superoxide dismutase
MLLAVTMFTACNNESSKPEENAGADTTAKKDTGMQMPMPDTSSLPMVKAAAVTLTGTYSDTTLSGTANFETLPDGKVKMTLEITVPSKAGKEVAVHLHEHGDCADNGKASHGHWNPTNSQHGKWGSASFHVGDIGNVKLNSKGKGTTTLTTDLWTLGGKPDKNILGKAMIVHGGTDDYTTQPTGNAGSRIGCGVIQGK